MRLSNIERWLAFQVNGAHYSITSHRVMQTTVVEKIAPACSHMFWGNKIVAHAKILH